MTDNASKKVEKIAVGELAYGVLKEEVEKAKAAFPQSGFKKRTPSVGDVLDWIMKTYVIPVREGKKSGPELVTTPPPEVHPLTAAFYRDLTKDEQKALEFITEMLLAEKKGKPFDVFIPPLIKECFRRRQNWKSGLPSD